MADPVDVDAIMRRMLFRVLRMCVMGCCWFAYARIRDDGWMAGTWMPFVDRAGQIVVVMFGLKGVLDVWDTYKRWHLDPLPEPTEARLTAGAGATSTGVRA